MMEIKVGDKVTATSSWQNREETKWRLSYINKVGVVSYIKDELINTFTGERKTTYTVSFEDGNDIPFSEGEIKQV